MTISSSSRQPSVSRDNGKRLGLSSVMLRAVAVVAQESNPGMTVFATVVADVWGRWVGILPLFPPRSFLFHLFVCFSSPLLFWLLPAQLDASCCDPRQAIPSCQCWCLWVWGRACRRPWSAARGGLLGVAPWQAPQTGYPLECDHLPCGVHGPAIVVGAETTWGACWGSLPVPVQQR